MSDGDGFDPRSVIKHFNFALLIVPTEMFGERATAFRRNFFRKVAESYMEYELMPDYAFAELEVKDIVEDVYKRILGDAAEIKKVDENEIHVVVHGCPISPFSMLKKYEAFTGVGELIRESIKRYPACPVVALVEELCLLAGYDVDIEHEPEGECSMECVTRISWGYDVPKSRGEGESE